MRITLDWISVLSGQQLHWILTGLLTTLALTIAGSIFASIVAILTLAMLIGSSAPCKWLALIFIQIFRNTPLLVQLLFWYFAGFSILPVKWQHWINIPHAWAVLPGNVALVTPEFLSAIWGMGLFFGVFLAEELRAGILSIPRGQKEAAMVQGFGYWSYLRYILLPQALANAWQPLIGQYLNLMKLTSITSGIGLAELTYQIEQIQGYSARSFEACAVGTIIYLLLGFILGWALILLGPSKVNTKQIMLPTSIALHNIHLTEKSS